MEEVDDEGVDLIFERSENILYGTFVLFHCRKIAWKIVLWKRMSGSKEAKLQISCVAAGGVMNVMEKPWWIDICFMNSKKGKKWPVHQHRNTTM